MVYCCFLVLHSQLSTLSLSLGWILVDHQNSLKLVLVTFSFLVHLL